MKAPALFSVQQFKDLCVWLFWLSAYVAFCVLFGHLLKSIWALIVDAPVQAIAAIVAASMGAIFIGYRLAMGEAR
ncbi:hypothetical protein BVH03_07900 [Pseudomonas sp. PA15(2017)]|uniref:hypothetical protein n=1 Tax=Pseudomonas sp. PA15(2017) TaxID=1932111 RepID=UPI00095F1D1D|nr:hypothetical protein [Pseudomonas sp. PA15(2017)]OLU32129.1 hypothetical protein BVH03_07900 [Pseudomonas sp. PA15(2017)]